MKVRVELINERGMLFSYCPQTKIEKKMLMALSSFPMTFDGGKGKISFFITVSTVSLDDNSLAFSNLKDYLKEQRKIDKQSTARRSKARR